MRRCRSCRSYSIPREAPKSQWWCSDECKKAIVVGRKSGRPQKADKAKVPRKKRKTIIALANEVAELLQRLVRIKAADGNGMAKCVTCGKVEHWTDLQGGHFIERGKSSTRILEENIQPQCRPCNAWGMKKASVVLAYREYMVDTYGADFVAWLVQEAKRTVKYRREDLLQRKAEVQAQLAELERGRAA